MSALFIPDGFTVDATIKFADGEVKLKFRPPMGDEVTQVFDKAVDPSVFLASKIVSWSGMGLEAMPATAENIKRLHAQFWQTLFNTICRYDVETEIKNS